MRLSPTDNPLLIVGRQYKEALRDLFLSEVHRSNGCAYLGDIDQLLPFIPPSRVRDVIHFDLTSDFPLPLNPFYSVPAAERPDVAQNVVDSFCVAYDYGPQLDMYLRTGSLAMMEVGGTLFSLYYLFTSAPYRAKVIARVGDKVLKDILTAYHTLTAREQHDRIQSVLNRLTPLVTDPRYRRSLGQKKTLRMSSTSIVLMSLPRSKKSEVLAGLFLSRYTGRAFIDYPKIHTGNSVPVIGTPSLGLLPESVREEMLATADFITYRTTSSDARILGDQLDPFEQDNPASLLTDYALVRPGPREAVAVELRQYPEYPGSAEAVRKRSRSQYHTPRSTVDCRLDRFITHLDYSPELRSR